MLVNIVNKSNNVTPYYATPQSAGVDLRAFLDNPIIIQPNTRVVIPTGLFIELPDGYEAQIRPRSGLAAKYGITVLNTPGTIDADYRGEIKVIIYNSGEDSFKIESGDRICQMVVKEYIKVAFQEVVELNINTERNDGGFGHTGNK